MGVTGALHALAHGLQDQFMEWAEALAGQRQVPGWDATVSRELVSYLRVSVTGAWRHGWQPAELVRHAGREKGDSHARMATDMIAGEMRGYAAATVDGRWLAQLSALPAEVWRGSDDAYLGRWRDREGDSPQATVIRRAGVKRDRYGRSRTRAFRQSFLMSYAIRIGERLAGATGDAERQVAAEAPGRNLLPVLAARHRAVDDAVDEMFGDRVSYHRTGRVSDSEGWYSGRAAADTAALHGRREVTAESA